MTCGKYLGLAAGVLLGSCLAPSPALAQTGPAAGPSPRPAVVPERLPGPRPAPATGATTGRTTTGPTVGPATPPAKRFDDRSLGAYLRQKSYKVEEQRLANGHSKFVTTIEKDGWRFVVDLSVRADGKHLDIYCHLGNPLSPGKASADRLLRLMELSRTTVGGKGFFSYVSGTRSLVLYDYCGNERDRFGPYLERVLQDVRNTYAAWSWAV